MADAATDFRWPNDPAQDWWEVQGASLGMTADLIRFAAALAKLGGQDAKKNSVAARLAGINCGRTQAFRYARSVAVKKLLDSAEQIKTGKRKRLTEEEIDLKIEDLINSPDAATVARGIELRAKRHAQHLQHEEWPEDDGFGDWRIEREYLSAPNGGCAFLLLNGGIGNLKLLHDTYAVVMGEEYGSELWARYYAQLNDQARADLDRFLADPSYQLTARKKIWGEINKPPPGPIDTGVTDWRVNNRLTEATSDAAA